MTNRMTVKFRDLNAPTVDTCVLELSKEMTYRELLDQLGEELKHDPNKIRLTLHSPHSDGPRMQPLKAQAKTRLTEMITNYYYLGGFKRSTSMEIIYFEKLDHTLSELENNRILKIAWFNDQVKKEDVHQVMVPTVSVFGDVIAKLKEKVGPLRGTGQIRLLEVHSSRIYRLLKPDERTQGYSDHTLLRAEEIPEEELKNDVKVIQVIHCSRDPNPCGFGDPFYLAVPKDEHFTVTKRRIQEKLDIPDEEFATWKFFISSYLSKQMPVQDDDCIATKLDKSDCLCLEHKPPRRANPYRRKEEQLVIKG
jgi:ubiquitin carboxyl-terminal hydrolase 7